MKAKYFTAGVLVAVLVIFATGAGKAKPNGIQWEYAKSFYSNGNWGIQSTSPNHKLINIIEYMEDHPGDLSDEMFLLEYAGDSGWELCGLNKAQRHYFKRPKQ